jgi:Rrf2 family transcriptional regulator, iron-sulfur cluster assembly transcription factor
LIRRTTKYALNVLRCLAREPDRRTPTDRLAQETGVPANYLSKILSQLRKHDVVEGEKGWRGGFRLQPGALDRSIRSIDEIFDKRPKRSTSRECIFGLALCDGTNPCALHERWERVRAERDAMFTTITVRDLLRAEGRTGAEGRR